VVRTYSIDNDKPLVVGQGSKFTEVGIEIPTVDGVVLVVKEVVVLHDKLSRILDLQSGIV
jgi:hypothetical protein